MRRAAGIVVALSSLRKDKLMELRIGILHSPRELAFETNQSAAEIEKLVAEAIAADAGVARFTDERDRVILVNAAQIAFVEIGEETVRRVGFTA